MTLKKFALEYTACALEELQGFMKARGIKAKKGKVACITALESADRNANFLFQELPGELRNAVYFELLLLPKIFGDPIEYIDSRKKCHPQILATCSEIRDEASSILYSANELCVLVRRTISTHSMSAGLVDCTVDTVPLRTHMLDHTVELGVAHTRSQNRLSTLLQFEKARIHIISTTTRNIHARIPQTAAFRALHSLVSVLQQSKALKSVTIEGDTSKGSQFVPEAELLKELYHLSRLCANIDCTFEGFKNYPNVVRSLCLNAEENNDVYKVDIQRKVELIREESEAYKALSEVTAVRKHKQRHTKLCRSMNRASLNLDVEVDNLSLEKALLGLTNEMGQFLDSVYEKDTLPALASASGFWLDLLNDFKDAHEARLLAFPK